MNEIKIRKFLDKKFKETSEEENFCYEEISLIYKIKINNFVNEVKIVYLTLILISVVINGNIVNKSIIEKVEFNRSKFTKIYLVGEIVSNNNLNIFIKVLT